jgi:Domain of unknown function (DUF4288)
MGSVEMLRGLLVKNLICCHYYVSKNKVMNNSLDELISEAIHDSDYWFVKIRYKILIDRSKIDLIDDNGFKYEERIVIVMADSEEEVMKIVENESKISYSKPYKNVYEQNLTWEFDKILEIAFMQEFKFKDLYKNKIVEIHSKLS